MGLRRREGLNVPLILFYIVLCLFIGLRDEVGPDWTGYLNIFAIAQNAPETLGAEQLFAMLNVASGFFGLGIYGVVFCSSAIFLIGLGSFAQKTSNPWLATTVVLPYLVFIIGMSGLRQAAAIGIIYFALARWDRIKTLTKYMYVGIAAGFHASSVLMIYLILFENRRNIGAKIAIMLTLFVYVILFGSQEASYTVETYSQRYYEQNVLSSGAYAHVALSAIPAAIFLLIGGKFKGTQFDSGVVRLGSWAAIVCLPMVAVSSTGADRVSLFFSYVQMWIYPALTKINPKFEYVIQVTVVLWALIIFFVYFYFGAMAYLYVPYRNVFQ